MNQLFNNKMIIQISVFISLVLHLIFFLGLRNIDILKWDQIKLKTYQVELLRPPTEGINPEDLKESQINQLNKEETQPEKPRINETEDTISLDTKDKRYILYTTVIKERILSHWLYPTEAKANLIEGRAQVLFSLGKNGELQEIKIMNSSGHAILDQEGIRAIQASAPFPPFPDHISAIRLHIKANLDYRIKR